MGPEPGTRCGISDYVQALLPAFDGHAETEFLSYSRAGGEAARFDALLLHYERSLMPGPFFLQDMGAAHAALFVVPHEVYFEDPFAFSPSSLRAPPGLLWAKRVIYRLRHREYGRETALQEQGYHSRGVFPLNAPAAEVLRSRCPDRLLETVPLAYYPAPAPADAAPRARFFSGGEPAFVIGIFGFLTPAHDYASVLDALAALPDTGLLVVGGTRRGPDLAPAILEAARERGVGGRIAVTGYVPEEKLGGPLAIPDAFVFPARFKSSSASLLRLFALGKPLLAADLPLTRSLLAEGGPLILYRGAELADRLRELRSGALQCPPLSYPHTFARVAQAYVAAIRRAVSSSS